MSITKKYTTTIFLVTLLGFKVVSQVLNIPPEEKSRTAPFIFNQDRIKSGEQVYLLNCKSCHGDPGKGNYAKLDPIPKDPASSDYQGNTDGEMFYILSHGKGLMPNFVNTLNEEQRWEVISYVRSFNKDYKQPPIKKAGEAIAMESAKLILAYSKTNNQIFATLTDSIKGARKPLPDVVIKLFVKRTFGNLNISQAITDKDGVAYFTIPNDIPGDKDGLLHFVGKAESKGKEIASEVSEKLGLAIQPKQLLDQRTWWNVNKMAPIWLILLYTSGVLGVYATVIYVLLQLRKILKSNQSNSTDHAK